VVRILNEGVAVEPLDKGLRDVAAAWSWTSQTKPGPNIDRAVVRSVLRKVSREEKDVVRPLVRASGILEGVGESDAKKKWLLCAIEA